MYENKNDSFCADDEIGTAELAPCDNESSASIDEGQEQEISGEANVEKHEETQSQPLSSEKLQELDGLLSVELRELSKSFADAPSNIDELMRQPEKEQIFKYLQHGLSISEAYTAACAGRLLQNARSAARQEAISGIYGKTHLAPLGGGVADEVFVPPDVMDVYHKMFPKMKDAEIRAEYKKQSDN
ncbi:MAG: hypothetical protein RR848_07280 [Oscillospiraceae bacterium]